MRDVTMLVLGVVSIYEPLLQLSVATNLHRGQIGNLEFQVSGKQTVLAQSLCGQQSL